MNRKKIKEKEKFVGFQKVVKNFTKIAKFFQIMWELIEIFFTLNCVLIYNGQI
jgi:hypothetical protein